MRKFKIFASATTIFFIGCGFNPFKRGRKEIPPQQISYSSDVCLILKQKCFDCHSKGGGAGGAQFVMTGDAVTDYPRNIQVWLV